MSNFLPDFEENPLQFYAFVVGGSLITFNVFSAICLRFPTILSPRAPSKEGAHSDLINARLIAHRGGRKRKYAENTIASFSNAIKCGCDQVELDVWLSKDGQVVVFHDKDFSRMCSGDGRTVVETNYEDFPSIVTPTLVAKDHYFNQFKVKDKKIPLLSEVLDSFPKGGFPVTIEFKMRSKELMEKVHKLISERPGQKSKTCWFSLDGPTNADLGNFDSTIPRISSVPDVIKIFLCFILGFLPFVKVSTLFVGWKSKKLTFEGARHEKALKSLPSPVISFLVYMFNSLITSKPMADHLKGRGHFVQVLDVNDEPTYDLAFRQVDANSVLTDDPDWLCEHDKGN